jgi:hypothetical protein
VIVRKDHRHVEANRGFGGEEIDGFWAMFDEGIDTGDIKAVAGLVAKLCARKIWAFLYAPGPG